MDLHTRRLLKCGYFVLVHTYLLFLCASATTRRDFPTVVFGIIVGMTLSDFIAGIAHWTLDNVRAIDNIIGALLGHDFVAQYMKHHEQPAAMVKQTFWETNTDGMFATALFVTGVHLAGFQTSLFSLYFWLTYGFFTGLTNQFHKWSHDRNRPAWVSLLQDLGILVHPSEHARHHTNHGTALCLTTGWCNGLLELVGFWDQLSVQFVPSPEISTQ